MSHVAAFSIRRRIAARPSFTLVELLIVIAILGVLASAVLVAAWGAQEDARAARTRSQIAKLNELIMNRWETYRTRPVAMRIPPSAGAGVAADARLWALRELMRRELPDRITDLTEPMPTFVGGLTLSRPTLWGNYVRRAQIALRTSGTNWQAPWTTSYQGAECLYMIVASMRDGDTNGLNSFHASEIGDVDGDGMLEILDAWGNPIEFIRWAPGLNSEIQSGDGSESPDPFDLLKADPRARDPDPANWTFALFPLIYSAGRDGNYDMNHGSVDYSTDTSVTSPPYSLSANPPERYPDPYLVPASGPRIGTPMDSNGNGTLEYQDNITNHLLGQP